MRWLAASLLLFVPACSDRSSSDESVVRPYRDAAGQSFRIVPGHVVDPPSSGAALRTAIREIARASMDTSTCTDPVITDRRQKLVRQLEAHLARLKAIGLSDEIAAGQADFGFSIREELRVGCSNDRADNVRSLDALEHWIDLLGKWET